MKKGRDVRRPGARSSTITNAAAPFSSTIPPRKLQCFSVACLDMPALEFGDKIVLPANVLMELQCFKIPTPMLFHIRAFGHEDPASNTDSWTQYCSVQEFSAPPGQVFIPYWMMQNLYISEGQDVLLTSVLSLPRGIYCRLQPEDSAFLTIAAEIGPKLLLESALRRYSVLSEHETILIIHGEQRFYVRVVELKPARVVSILGDVDLTVDFTAPETADPRRPKSSHRPAPDSTQHSQETPQAPAPTPEPISQVPIASSVTGCGRRLGDGVCVPEATTIAQPGQRNPPKLGTASFQAAQQRMHQQKHDLGVDVSVVAGRADTDGLATHIKQAQAAFTSFGNRLGGKQATTPEERPEAIEAVHAADQSSTIECSMCLAEISSVNIELHTVRCAKNPSYHKVSLSVGYSSL
ncbi:hypothetical protein Poli38472_008122 [Pythium oligandrum]|uniref:Ubiquitin fusion degradation protein n=1 Tax=Pythium oligandrum TaxID=41045 RepID=A0A8K1CMT8_PYTOL|nr:hypothetical protein Poli38472_008122 [Pythium oligandrum]|eukprot:TMW65480.1 hypothetical protein Poli38472_008122 [Pythium oligandrum]